MKYSLLIAAFIACIGNLFGQAGISGRVLTSTETPIAGSSVFISNTSIGTTTDRNGNFSLSNIPPGKYDLIISNIGYETSVYSFSSSQLPLRVKVIMELKVKELQNVVVEASVEEGWDKWGKLFTENFVGSTRNARLCKIENTKSIKFRYYKKSNRLVAYCDEPIILVNKALGYRLRYQLEDFEVNFKQRSSAFSGYPFFEEIDKKRSHLQNRWHDKRNEAYYGSMMHFMRSLYTNSLEKDGFEVRRMWKVINGEKQRIRSFYKPGMFIDTRPATRAAVANSGAGNEGKAADSVRTINPDSIAYYRRIMGQDDSLKVYGDHYLSADSLLVGRDGAYALLNFPNYLFITYKKESEDPLYLEFYHESRSPAFQSSIIWITNGEGILIDINGSYFPPQAVYSMAYWGWSEKMSDILPIEFTPEEK